MSHCEMLEGSAVSLSTHVLDAARGRPAAGMAVTLSRGTGSGWEPLARGVTDADGRLRPADDSGAEINLSADMYRLDFDTGAYFAATGQTGFYPLVSIVFEVTDPGSHQHVPLLLSPFAYSTYRGS
jgi:5-hydroxyisourate hydrolase